MAAARAMNAPEIARPPTLPRLLAGVSSAEAPSTLAEHVAIYGQLPPAGAIDLPALVEASGLQGRGGAGFPTATKLRAVAAHADNRSLSQTAPRGSQSAARTRSWPYISSLHLVLDGAARRRASPRCVRGGTPLPCPAPTGKGSMRPARNRRAWRQARQAGPACERRGPGCDSSPERRRRSSSFLNGGVAEPTSTPPRPFERGVGGRRR